MNKGICKNPACCKVWMYITLTARNINPFVITMPEMARDLDLTMRQVRYALSILAREGLCSTSSHGRNGLSVVLP